VSAPAFAILGPRRWHFQHGPIDLVIGADGEAAALRDALAQAWERFGEVLAELVAELHELRRPVDGRCRLEGPVARRMWAACEPFAPAFVTPMAAVAGSVAQEIAASFARPGVARAWVNNGGDIALHLAPGARVEVAVCADLEQATAALAAAACAPPRAAARVLPDRVTVDAGGPVRGVATSGWRGRSQSLGIADAVTVLAPTAAQADAAATLIANAVDCDHPAVERRPACELRDDTDLGERLVTVAVGALPAQAVDAALERGAAFAESLAARGLVVQAMLSLQGRSRIVAGPSAAMRAEPRPLEQTR
jgi:hypothetical protein